MTTSVRVSARARGARVETNGETVDLGPHENREFHIAEGSQSFTVTEFTAEEAHQREQEARGSDEQPADQQQPSEPASPPTGNESGADETAATTDTTRGRSARGQQPAG
jgi:hypothetical protein